MKLHQGISPRTVAITSIIVVLLSIGFHFYMQHNVRKFETTLPKLQATMDTSISPIAFNPDATEATLSGEETLQNGTGTEPTTPKNEENQVSTCAMATMENMATMEMSQMKSAEQFESDPETGTAETTKLYAGLTAEEVQQLWNELSSPYVANADEKFDLLGDVLVDQLGPDPRIPEYIRGLKTVHILQNIELSRTNNEEDVDNYLSYLPAVFANNFVELTIDLFELPPERASEMRDLAGQVAVEVDTLTLLQETRPWVQDAIDTGVLSPEDGELVIESVTGLKVTMPGEDRTTSTGDSRTYTGDFTAPQKVASPESVHPDIPQLLGD
ncbi:MAG: hypothetical protein OXN25_21100 [Candidatus Poribacteria bacterium]|nr:hypothetical protein [Candidatus Poribacteria bacterium]